MLCPNCGKDFSEEYQACPDCGWEPVPGQEASVSEVPAEDMTNQALPAEPSVTEDPEATDASAETTMPEPIEEPSGAEPAEDTAESAEAAESEAPEEEAAESAMEASETESPEEDESTEAAEAGEDSAESKDTEDAGNPEEADTEEKAEEPARKKRSVLPALLGAIVCLLVIIVVCLTVALTTLSKTGKMPGFVTSIQNLFHRDNFDSDGDALRILNEEGEEIATLNNEQFSFYYWGEVYYFLQSSGMAFDPSLPLNEQEYADGQTWQDFFMENATASARQVEAMKAEAEASGFEMSETYQQEYDSILESMPDYAAQAGFTDDQGNGDLLAYVRDSYGSGATVESFEQYLYDSYYVTAYSDQIYQDVTVDDASLDSWYDENQDMYQAYGILKSELPNINVRHILIAPETLAEDASEADLQKAKEEARAEAERILKEWEDGEATEESFGELANTYSTDGGSNTTGGLYEDVYPGQMVESFNDWCFDEARQTGDTGIVESDYGYHIMYYVGATENYYWKQAAEGDLHYKLYEESIQTITDKYTSETADSLELSTPTAITALAEQASPADSAAAAAE